MFTLKNRVLRLSLGSFFLLGMLIASSASAFAATSAGGGGTSSTLNAGPFTQTNDAPTIGAITLSGSNQTVALVMPLTVIDATGSGAGWNVAITSTTFTVGTHKLSTTATNVNAITAACDTNSTCTLPTNAIVYPLPVPAADTAPTAVKLFNAAVNTGMGSIVLTPTILITIPANTYAGAYSSTITLTLVSTP